jgi:hypothetical protein
VHLSVTESEYANRQLTWLDRQRYRPQQWNTKGNWRLYNAEAGDRWFGLQCVRTLNGLPPEIALIPLIGHTHGHAGAAIQRGDRWLLQAGDAYFYHAEMDYGHPRCTPGLKFYQWMMDKNRGARLANQHRLRELKHAHGREMEVFCAHDIEEFERVSGHSARIPAEMLSRPAHA